MRVRSGRSAPITHFGMLARELLPAAGCARLENHGGTLGAGLGQTRTRHAEVLALVLNRVHLGGVCVDALLAVFDDRTVFPGAFPELVADVQELFGEFVSGVVLNLGFKALTFGCGSRYEVTTLKPYTPVSEMVKGSVLACERVRLLVGHG